MIWFSRRAVADDLCSDEKTVFLEVLAFLTGVTDFHRSSDLRARLENKSTFLLAFANDGLLRSLSRIHTPARQVARNRRPYHGEIANLVSHHSVGARPTSIDCASHTSSENGKGDQEEKRIKIMR